ncbi:MAG: cadherin-like beta sandwich domain-containing protein, partial [Clostridiales bacterium]|nr:cadherin-like beta sandwich domain-containing protein [Clostridiales bacterium]
PLDNTAFIYADISNLVPTPAQVEVTNPADFKAADARLASLTIGALSLTPAFNKSIHYYTLATANATNTITALAKDGEGTIAILVNDEAHTNGAAATWDAGANTVEITVTVGSETETYTVDVTKS